MSNNTTNATNFKPIPNGQKCMLAKTRQYDKRVYPTPVVVEKLLHLPGTQYCSDGKYRPTAAIYYVRELATGIQYPADADSLRPYRPASRQPLPRARVGYRFPSLALMA